jgi:hypothetical protein
MGELVPKPGWCGNFVSDGQALGKTGLKEALLF